MSDPLIPRMHVYWVSPRWYVCEIDLSGEIVGEAEFRTKAEALDAAQSVGHYAAIDIFSKSNRLMETIPPKRRE